MTYMSADVLITDMFNDRSDFYHNADDPYILDLKAGQMRAMPKREWDGKNILMTHRLRKALCSAQALRRNCKIHKQLIPAIAAYYSGSHQKGLSWLDGTHEVCDEYVIAVEKSGVVFVDMAMFAQRTVIRQPICVLQCHFLFRFCFQR